jgi:hypothetical protein
VSATVADSLLAHARRVKSVSGVGDGDGDGGGNSNGGGVDDDGDGDEYVVFGNGGGGGCYGGVIGFPPYIFSRCCGCGHERKIGNDGEHFSNVYA